MQTELGCDVYSTRCPTWVSAPYDLDNAQNVPSGDVTALSPDGQTVYVGVSSGEAGVQLVALDAEAGERRWATSCCEARGVGFASAAEVVTTPNGRYVVVAGDIEDRAEPGTRCTGILNTYDARNGALLWAWRQPETQRCWLPRDMTVHGSAVFVAATIRDADGRIGSSIQSVAPLGPGPRTLFRTRKDRDGSGDVTLLETLTVSPDGRRLVATGLEGTIPEGSAGYDFTGWFVRSFRILDGGLSPVWRFGRRPGANETNPIAGVAVMAGRVVITGSFLGPFRTFTIGLRARDGIRMWEQGVPTSQPIPHAPLAYAGSSVFVAIGNWESSIALDGTNDVIAYDARTGEELWHDSFRSTNQDTAASYDFGHFPMVFADPASGVLYEVLRGYGAVEVRALTIQNGTLRWYSSYRTGRRTGAVDAGVDAATGSLFVGAYAVMDDVRHGDTIVLRYDEPL